MITAKIILVTLGAVVLPLELLMLADLMICSTIEKYKGLWPLCDYYCVCGYHIKVNNFWPSNTYRLWKALKHDKGCLSRLMFFWGSNVSPKWQNYACEEMIRQGKTLTKSDWKSYENLTRSDAGLPQLPFNIDDY